MKSFSGSEDLPYLRPIILPALGEEPLVSVLLTNYNYGAFVSDAIESVLSQNYPHIELVIVDDGSTDDSLDKIKGFEGCPNLKIIARPVAGGSGHAVALNQAFAESTGGILCLLDADDLFESSKVACVVDAFREAPTSGLCVHALTHVDARLRPLCRPPSKIERGWLAPSLFATGSVTLPGTTAIALRRMVADRIFPIPGKLRRLSDAFINLMAVCQTEVTAIDVPLARYRIHGANLSNSILPSAYRLEYTLSDIEQVSIAVNDHLAQVCPPKDLPQLDISKNVYYCEMTLALNCLQGRRLDPRCLMGLPSTKRRRLWRYLSHLPRQVTWVWLAINWGAGLKYYTRLFLEVVGKRVGTIGRPAAPGRRPAKK